jgi:hypothetical protein
VSSTIIRIETEHRCDRRGDHEHERQQPLRASPRAAGHHRADRIKQPLAPAAVGDQQHRREKTNRRPQNPKRVTRR